MLKRVEVFREGGFKDLTVNRFLVHDSPYMRVINFNFRAGQELPVTTMPLKASSPSWCWRAGGLSRQGRGRTAGPTGRCPYFRHRRAPWPAGGNRYAGAGDHRAAALISRQPDRVRRCPLRRVSGFCGKYVDAFCFLKIRQYHFLLQPVGGDRGLLPGRTGIARHLFQPLVCRIRPDLHGTVEYRRSAAGHGPKRRGQGVHTVA